MYQIISDIGTSKPDGHIRYHKIDSESDSLSINILRGILKPIFICVTHIIVNAIYPPHNGVGFQNVVFRKTFVKIYYWEDNLKNLLFYRKFS